jgi:chromosomal replication initiator protein
MNEKECWNLVLAEMEQSLSKANFQTWFSGTGLYKIDGSEVIIAVPNDFVKDWLDSKYKLQVLEIIRGSFPSIRALTYVVKQLPKNELVQPKTPLYERITQALPLESREDGLNPKYSFDNFIVASFNELAYAASMAIIKTQAVYNPLFIYGNTGLGKTHLLQATGNSLKDKSPNKKVVYTTLERFYNDYVVSVQQNKSVQFREKYRRGDVIIIDDIQFISGKEKTQEELFHLFNDFHNIGKQIIFSSDKHPNLIVGLEERLRTRFNAGMTIDVSSPEFEARMLILREKTKEYANLVDDNILTFIAESVTGSIRELEGVINLVLCHCDLKKQPVTINEAKQLLRNHISSERSNKKPEDIINIIAKYYDINPVLVSGKTRRQDVVYPRQITIYILREFFNISYQMIGEKLGGRDHTTIMHSYEKIKTERNQKANINKEIDEIKTMIT